MESEIKIDFTQEPMRIELGNDLCQLITDECRKNEFLKAIKIFRESIKNAYEIELPDFKIVDNFDLGSNHYRIVLYGKIIFSFRMFQKKFWIQDILGTLKTWASYNLFYFTDEFKQNIEYLNEKQQEQTREAYQFLYHYYTKIEPDKKQSFHWLKKLSFYGIQGELRSLAKCYANGDGCEVDRILGDKLLDIIDKQRIYRYYGWEKNKF